MKKIIKSDWVYLIPVLAVFIIWYFYPTWAMYSVIFGRFVENGNGISALGTFGDSFGALNTLFSGLAFVGLYISLRLQSKELSETRDVLKDQSEQLTKQSKQFEEQTNGLIRQTFETTFFQLIKHYSDAVDNVSIQVKKSISDSSMLSKVETLQATDVYAYFIKGYTGTLHNILTKDPISEYEDFFNDLMTRGAYKNTFNEPMRVLERILFFVHQSNFSRKEKVFYLSLLSAQMTKSEMQFIFYYGLSNKGGVKNIIERSGLLANFELECVLPFKIFTMYKLYAYGDFSSMYWDESIAKIININNAVKLFLSSQETGFSFKIAKPKSISEFKRLFSSAQYFTMSTAVGDDVIVREKTSQ